MWEGPTATQTHMHRHQCQHCLTHAMSAQRLSQSCPGDCSVSKYSEKAGLYYTPNQHNGPPSPSPTKPMGSAVNRIHCLSPEPYGWLSLKLFTSLIPEPSCSLTGTECVLPPSPSAPDCQTQRQCSCDGGTSARGGHPSSWPLYQTRRGSACPGSSPALPGCAPVVCRRYWRKRRMVGGGFCSPSPSWPLPHVGCASLETAL